MRLKQGLARRIVLPGDLVVVPGDAVRFDDELLSGPTEIRDDAATLQKQRLVHVWRLEACTEDEVEYDVFEDAPGRSGPIGQDQPELPCPSPVAQTLEDLNQVANAK
jgi:hypothetical protein